MSSRQGQTQLDQEIVAISRSTRTLLPIAAPWHDHLRMLLPWYYHWHKFKHASLTHLCVLFTYVAFIVSFIGSSIITPNAPLALASSIGPNDPGTIANNTQNEGTFPWSNESNAASNDGAYASSQGGTGSTTDYLLASNFGFDALVPAAATIDGVIVEVQKDADVTMGNTYDAEVKLVLNGTATGNNKASVTSWPVADDNTYSTYGGASDKWGIVLSYEDVISPNFGVALSATVYNPELANIRVDHIRMTVHYTMPAAQSVQFTATASNDAESVTSKNIEVSLSGVAGSNVTVNYAVTGGTASGSGTDYTLASGTATISAGNLTTNIPITVVNDSIDEDNETIQITLSNPVNATLGANTVHTYTINDNDDPPTVQFQSASSSGVESSSASIPVTLSSASGKTVTIQYDSSNGTASAGSDYTAVASQTLTFNPGETLKNLNLTVTNDSIDENDETFNITISNPANASLGATTAHTYTISDNDDPPTVSFAAATSTGAESTTPAVISVSLSAESAKSITVDYSTSNGSASVVAGDYASSSGTLTFAAGELSKTFNVTVTNDSLDEDDETFVAALANPTNATLGATTAHTYTITDNDASPTVTISLSSLTISENGGVATLTAELSQVSGRSVTVNMDIAGTATNASDYSRSGTAINIIAGNTTGTVTLTGIDDLKDEENETVILDVGSVINGVEDGNQQAILTLTDDDEPPMIQFSSASSNGNEGISPAEVIVSLSTVSGKTITVSYDTVNVTAQSGTDYAETSGIATINPGSTTQIIPVPIIDDLVDEEVESFALSLTSPANASLGTRNSHRFMINDNDSEPSVTLSVSGSPASEDGGSLIITASLTAASEKNITVNLGFAGTAIQDDDYRIEGSTITIAAGELSGDLTISPVNDSNDETDESVIVSIESTNNAVENGEQSVTGTITDNSFSIVAQSNEGGTITPAGTTTLVRGGSQTYAISANSGFDIASIAVDGISLAGNLTSLYTYRFENVTRDHTLSVQFRQNSFSISLTAIGGGTLSVDNQHPAYGGTAKVTIQPNANYYLASLTDNGNRIANSSSLYTITNITSDHTIRATFALISGATTLTTTEYSLTTDIDENSLITPSGIVKVTGGGSQTFLISARIGYEVDSVAIDGVPVGSITSYDFTNVTSDHTIQVRSKLSQSSQATLDNNKPKKDTGNGLKDSAVAVISSTVKSVKSVALGTNQGLKTASSTIQKITSAIGISQETASVSLSGGAVIATAAALPLAPLSNALSMYSLLEFVHSIWYSLLAFSGVIKAGKKRWGRVVEAGSDLPLPGVRVNLIAVTGPKEKKVVGTVYTNKDGAYGFVAEPGHYKLEVVKQNYQVVAPVNFNHTFEIRNYSEGLVVPTFSLALDSKVAKSKIKYFAAMNMLERFFVYLSFVLLTLGSVVSLDKTINHYNITNVIITVVYLIFWFLGLKKTIRVSPWGTVVDADASKPLPLTLIRVLDKTGKRLIKTSITNEIGKFSTLVQKGEYTVIAAKPGYKLNNPLELSATDKLNVVNKKIKMSKLS